MFFLLKYVAVNASMWLEFHLPGLYVVRITDDGYFKWEATKLYRM